MNCLVRMKFGSHLYGTATPESDTDWKGVHVPAARDILLQRAAGEISAGTGRVKADGERNRSDDVDDKSYALHRFLQLAVEGQTVVLDMLFAPPGWIEANGGVASLAWYGLLDQRHRLLTKKSAAFVGYCRQQANKYGIKGSRVAAARDAEIFFLKAVETYGPQTKLNEIVEYDRSGPGGALAVVPFIALGEHSGFVTKADKLGREETFFECCNRKVSLNNTVKAAYEMYARVHKEYGDRARKAESNDGVDWKALSHAVRVGQEAIELLTTGHITFPLPQAEYVLAVKRGLLSYAQVAEVIESLLVGVERAAVESALPEEVDREFIDDFVVKVYRREVRYA